MDFNPELDKILNALAYNIEREGTVHVEECRCLRCTTNNPAIRAQIDSGARANRNEEQDWACHCHNRVAHKCRRNVLLHIYEEHYCHPCNVAQLNHTH